MCDFLRLVFSIILGGGTCICSLRWAMTRCMNGIVESGSLLPLLQVNEIYVKDWLGDDAMEE